MSYIFIDGGFPSLTYLVIGDLYNKAKWSWLNMFFTPCVPLPTCQGKSHNIPWFSEVFQSSKTIDNCTWDTTLAITMGNLTKNPGYSWLKWGLVDNPVLIVINTTIHNKHNVSFPVYNIKGVRKSPHSAKSVTIY